MTASDMAKRSHEVMREKYGGTTGYRDHMREIASKPRKKRAKPYDTTAQDPNSVPASPSMGGTDCAASRNTDSGVK